MCVCVFLFFLFFLFFSLVLDPSLFLTLSTAHNTTHNPPVPRKGRRKEERKGEGRMEGKRPSSLCLSSPVHPGIWPFFFFFGLDIPIPSPLFPCPWRKNISFSFYYFRLGASCAFLWLSLSLHFPFPSSLSPLSFPLGYFFRFSPSILFLFGSHIYRYFPFRFFARYRFPGDVIAHRVPHPPPPLYMYKKRAPEGEGREGRGWGWGHYSFFLACFLFLQTLPGAFLYIQLIMDGWRRSFLFFTYTMVCGVIDHI